MTQKLLLRLCFVLLPMLSMAQSSQDSTRILELEKKWTDAYKQHEVNTMTSLLSEDVVVTVEDGRSFGRIGYISHTADSGVQVEVTEESDVRVRMHSNVAVVTGIYHETGTAKGKRYEYRDRFTDVWMKTGIQWQLIAAQYSVPVQQ
jgi:ketosteroid isomerase-like protein